MGKPEGKRPFGRPRGRWVGNIKNVSSKIGMGYGLIWYGSEQDQVVSCCKRGNKPSDYIGCGELLD